jgi:hypothetical protein
VVKGLSAETRAKDDSIPWRLIAGPRSSALRPERESPSSTDSPGPVPTHAQFAGELTPLGGVTAALTALQDFNQF